MLLHDISDPLMEMAKLFLYSNQQFLANLFFMLFSFTFMITRDIIYPICIISPLFYNTEATKHVQYLEVYIGALSTIAFLNLFWTLLILKMIQGHLTKGNVEGDIRE